MRTKGAAEMLLKRRLWVLGELICEFSLKLNVVFVSLERNKSDILTRIKMVWLEEQEESKQGVTAVCQLNDSELRGPHAMQSYGHG